jgi:hypothetical protein
MSDTFVEATTLSGQHRIREYVLAWIERLDYADRLDRAWPADELGARIWYKVEQEFSAVWTGGVTDNRALAEVIAAVAVEDYYTVFPQRRACRYVLDGPLGDHTFRRCAIDFVHDLEEYEPALLPACPDEAARMFWDDASRDPGRWGCRPHLGPLVDDEPLARDVAREAIREYYTLRRQVHELGAG